MNKGPAFKPCSLLDSEVSAFCSRLRCICAWRPSSDCSGLSRSGLARLCLRRLWRGSCWFSSLVSPARRLYSRCLRNYSIRLRWSLICMIVKFRKEIARRKSCSQKFSLTSQTTLLRNIIIVCASVCMYTTWCFVVVLRKLNKSNCPNSTLAVGCRIIWSSRVSKHTCFRFVRELKTSSDRVVKKLLLDIIIKIQ